MCHIKKINPIPCFKAEKFTITISTDTKRYKIIKLIFSRKDGSFFLTFPYFKNSKGIVSVATMRRGMDKGDINLEDQGKITSHLIKYSHHPDGAVVFSQTGRVFSKIRKKSKSLHGNPGHIFTIQLQDLNGFESVINNSDDIQTKKERTLNFHFNNVPDAIKILGYWHTKEYLALQQDGAVSNPATYTKDKSGKIRACFLISSFDSNPSSNSILILMAESIPRLTEEAGPHLTFIGGFDSTDVVNDLSQETKFLAFTYPVNGFNQLKNLIGSIDYMEDKQKD